MAKKYKLAAWYRGTERAHANALSAPMHPRCFMRDHPMPETKRSWIYNWAVDQEDFEHCRRIQYAAWLATRDGHDLSTADGIETEGRFITFYRGDQEIFLAQLPERNHWGYHSPETNPDCVMVPCERRFGAVRALEYEAGRFAAVHVIVGTGKYQPHLSRIAKRELMPETLAAVNELFTA